MASQLLLMTKFWHFRDFFSLFCPIKLQPWFMEAFQDLQCISETQTLCILILVYVYMSMIKLSFYISFKILMTMTDNKQKTVIILYCDKKPCDFGLSDESQDICFYSQTTFDYWSLKLQTPTAKLWEDYYTCKKPGKKTWHTIHLILIKYHSYNAHASLT